MRRIYIAGKLRGQNVSQNIELARKVAIKYWAKGFFVFCPHLNSGGMIGEAPEEIFIEGNMQFLAMCDTIVMMKGWGKSEGAKNEFKFACERGLRVIFE